MKEDSQGFYYRVNNFLSVLQDGVKQQTASVLVRDKANKNDSNLPAVFFCMVPWLKQNIPLCQCVGSLDAYKSDSAKRGGIGPKVEEVAFHFYGKDLKERKEHQVRGALNSFIIGRGFYKGEKKKHIK